MNMIFLSVVQREGDIFGQNAFSNIGLYLPMDKKINKAQYQFPKDFVKHTNGHQMAANLSTLALVMAMLGRRLLLFAPWLNVAKVGSESDLVILCKI